METKLGISSFGITFIIILMFLLSWIFTNLQKDDALVVNLAGRQRMLSQKMTKEVLGYRFMREKTGREFPEAAENIRNTMKVFDLTLSALKDSGPAPLSLDLTTTEYRDCPRAREPVYTQLAKVDDLWKTFSGHIEAVLNSREESDEQLAWIVENSVPLLEAMNRAVSMMQEQSEKKVGLLLGAQMVGILFGVCFVIMTIITLMELARALNNLRNEILGHKQAEEEILQQREEQQIILDSVPAMIFYKDKENRFLRVNQNLANVFGMSKEEILGKTAAELSPVEDKDYWEDDKKVIESAIPKRNIIEPVETSEGIKWFQTDKIPYKDKEGKIIGIIGFSVDITERKRAEKALRLTQFAVDHAGEAAYWIGSDAKFFYVNEASCRALGYTHDELLSMTVHDIGPDFPKEVWADHWKDFQKRKSFTFETTHLAKDGHIFPVEITVNYMEFEGNEYNCAFVKNITERKQLEEERIKASKLESIGVLAGGIAHDFNNILTVIMGNISLANIFAGEDVKKTRELLAEAERASLKARDLTQQLQTFSKGGEPVRKKTSLAGLIKDSATLSLRGSNVTSRVYIQKDLWVVEVDAGQIGQMIDNIIINADQAMPEGGTISVRAVNVTVSSEDVLPLAEGRYVRITIKDQGTGIPEEHLPKIFDPYFTTKQTGSGLGLTTSYSIVKRHGGHLAVESERDIGTTFQIYLPASAEQAEREEEERVETAVIKGRVLVMDDKRKVREVAIRMLEHIGHEAECAKNGTQAIEMYEQAKDSGRPFDVVILDLTIPGGMGGRETIEKLKEIDPKVKAIVASGYSNDPVMSEPEKYGFRGTVSKPYRIEELREVLRSVLKEKNG